LSTRRTALRRGAPYDDIFTGVNPQLAVMATIRGGVFTRADARACGYDRAAIERLLSCGTWRAVGRGRYALRRMLIVVDDEMLHLRRVYAQLRDGPPGLVASHQSAVALQGLPLWGLDLSTVHVTSDRGRPGPMPGGVRRHVCELPTVRDWNGLRLVAPDRAVAEVAATAPAEAAVVVADAACHAGLASPATLAVAAATLENGRARARSVLSGIANRSCSVGESRLRYRLRAAGLPEPSDRPAPLEFEYGDVEGQALWFPDQRTVVEFDPWLPYWGDCRCLDDGADAFGADHEPPPVEHVWVSWADLDHPDLVADRIRSAFARAAARSGVRKFDLNRRRTGGRRRTRPLDEPGGIPC
jgi:Transcriptional regulator, AbiEi antitoxin